MNLKRRNKFRVACLQKQAHSTLILLKNLSQNYLSFSFLVFFMEFRELSDFEWGIIKPLLPPRSRVGRPRADDRRIINGILYFLTTGCRWMDMPPEYGSYKTAWRRLKRWQDEGVWERC